MSENLPGFEGLGVPSTATAEWETESHPPADGAVGVADDVLHPGATGVRRPRPMRVTVPSGTPVVLLVSSGPSEQAMPTVVMPDIRHTGIERATRKMAHLGLVLQASPTYAPGIGANRVAVQYPEPGMRIPRGSTVSVLTSNGRKPPKGLTAQLPDLVGTLASDAEHAVFSAGLRPVVMRSPHPSAHPEIVFAQLPNAHVAKGPGRGVVARSLKWVLAVTVWLAVLAGLFVMFASPVTMPDVTGQKFRDASRELRLMGMRLGPETVVPSDATHLAGRVVGQVPAPGTQVRRLSTVRLSITGTPAIVLVPDTVGMRLSEARWVVGTIAKYRVVEREGTGQRAGIVVAQDPAGGTEVTASTVVNLYVSKSR